MQTLPLAWSVMQSSPGVSAPQPAVDNFCYANRALMAWDRSAVLVEADAGRVEVSRELAGSLGCAE